MRAKKSQKSVLALRKETAPSVSARNSERVSSPTAASTLQKQANVFVLLALLAVAALVTNGCAGLVSGTNTLPPGTILSITNVQATTSTYTAQVVWTTNVASDSWVDYGTTPSFGSSTPVDPTMVTTHQVTISGLAAGTTYYYQVNSTDSKGNRGNSFGHSFATRGF